MMRAFWAWVLVMAMALGLAGCSSVDKTSGAVGTYVSQNNPRAYIELRRGGDCCADLFGVGMADHGSWELNGHTVTIEFSDGSVAKAELQGDTLVFPEDSLIGFDCGTHWRKKR